MKIVRTTLSRQSGPALPSIDRSSDVDAVILDLDGVVLDSPHAESWRRALGDMADPRRLTDALYREEIAGRPRLEGARAALAALGVVEPGALAPAYAARKQAVFERLSSEHPVAAYPDALIFIDDLTRVGLPIAAASSSRNAERLLRAVRHADASLRDRFAVALCGETLGAGKPDPGQFLAVARALGVPPARCLVVEDSPNGVLAARRGGFLVIGVARDGAEAALYDAGADLVVRTLDAVDRSLFHRPPRPGLHG